VLPHAGDHNRGVGESSGISGRVPPTVVVTDAGLPPQPGAPQPFRRLESDDPARIVLRQIDPTNFELVEGFRYVGPAGSWTVSPADLSRTDLASIPWFLGWFVSRYGTHTLAALLHDHLVSNGERLHPPVARHTADDVFRDALDDLGVPFLRARIMWAAVVFATRWRRVLIARLALVVWLAAALAGITALVWSAATMRPGLFVVALLGPIPFALFWGVREYRAGVVGGYTVWLVAAPALLNLAAYGIYAVAERGLRRLVAVRPDRRAADLPEPPPYTAR